MQDEQVPFSPDAMTYWVVILANAMRRRMETLIAPSDINTLQYTLLDMISRGQTDTVTEIARVIPPDASAVSRNVEQLRARGLIRSRRLRQDRRIVRLSVTEEGERVLRELEELVLAEEQKLFEGVSAEERRVLRSAAEKILVNMGAWPANPS